MGCVVVVLAVVLLAIEEQIDSHPERSCYLGAHVSANIAELRHASFLRDFARQIDPLRADKFQRVVEFNDARRLRR